MAGEIAVGPVKPVPSGNILNNLLSHSDFDNAGWTSGANCTVSYDSTIKKYGDYSLKVTSTASSTTECYFYSDQYPPQIQGHIYYGRCEMYQDTAGVSSGMQIYWPEAEPSMGSSSYDSSNINTWQIQSFRVVRNSWSSGNQRFRFDVEQIRSPNYVYVDGAMLIDLTATYGAGNEPTQAWCDANIPYFSGTIINGKLKAGDVIDFDYKGAVQSISLPAGKYKLEVWGAQGGSSGYHNTIGGKGGYSVGVCTLDKETELNVYVGGMGNTGSYNVRGGWNGGGGVTNSYNAGGNGNHLGTGGGASDISLIGGEPTLDGYNRFIRTEESYKSRLIVAGGGGGAEGYAGTAGGGTTGVNDGYGSYGGTQSSGGAFSYGASSASNWVTMYPSGLGYGTSTSGGHTNHAMGSCGGGGYYGGGAYGYNGQYAHGYGGSGFISSVLSDAQTIAGSESITSPSGGSETGHTGNGFARITVIEVSPTFSAPVKISGNWKVASDGLVKINGAWKSVEQGFVKINGTWKEIS